jgi:hypothetical protein
MARWTRRVGIFTIVLAAVSFVSAIIFYFQLVAMQTQATIMQNQLNEMRSPSAERPYLFIAHDDRAPIPEGPEILDPGKILRVLFKNYGRTPAVYRGFYPRCGYSLTSPPNLRYPSDKWASSVLVGSSETIGPLECPLEATKEEIARAQSGTGYLFMAGKIGYDDLSGLPHETGFCLVYKPSTNGFGLMTNDATCNYYR